MRGILNQDWPDKSAEKAIQAEFRSLFPIFWCEAADRGVESIRQEESIEKLNEMFCLVADVEFRNLVDVDPTTSAHWQDAALIAADPSQDLFGRTYQLAFLYGRLARGRSSNVNTAKALARQKVLLDKLFAFLDQRSEDDVAASLIRGKLRLERVGLVAEQTEDNAALKDYVDATEYFQSALAYNQIAPRLWRVPWSALAIASRLKLRSTTKTCCVES